MQRARRSAGMAPLPAPAPSGRISPMPGAGRVPGRITPTPTLPGEGRPGGIRIDPPRGAPLSLGNDGPERVITNETLRAPAENGRRPPEPPRTSNWRRFGNNQPAANPPLRQPEAPMRRPEPSRTTQPRSGADRSGAPPSISPGGSRPFSTPPRTSPAQRGGSISRDTVPYGSRPPEVPVPPQPRSASRDSFQNHPMGIIVAPIVVRPNPVTGNWGWQAGQPRSGGAATGNRPAAPVAPRMEPPRPAPSMNARPGMGMPQPRSNPPAAVSRPVAPPAAPRAQAPPTHEFRAALGATPARRQRRHRH